MCHRSSLATAVDPFWFDYGCSPIAMSPKP
jgi:hypothetical protein